VDENGKPKSGINVNLTYQDGDCWRMHAYIHLANAVTTDSKGLFIIDEVIPGMDFQLWPRSPKGGRDWKAFVMKVKAESGQTLDVGDVRLRGSP
jgi:hypothetical protein